jgi:hypothetical protein
VAPGIDLQAPVLQKKRKKKKKMLTGVAEFHPTTEKNHYLLNIY